MEDQFLKRIMELSKIRKYEAGGIITPEGSYDRWFYVLIPGEVVIVKKVKPERIYFLAEQIRQANVCPSFRATQLKERLV